MARPITEKYFEKMKRGEETPSIEGVSAHIKPTVLKFLNDAPQKYIVEMADLQDEIEGEEYRLANLKMGRNVIDGAEAEIAKIIGQNKGRRFRLNKHFDKFVRNYGFLPAEKLEKGPKIAEDLLDHVVFLKEKNSGWSQDQYIAGICIEMSKLAVEKPDIYCDVNEAVQRGFFRSSFLTNQNDLVDKTISFVPSVQVQDYYTINQDFSYSNPRFFALVSELKNIDKQIKDNKIPDLDMISEEVVDQARLFFESILILPPDDNKAVISDLDVIRLGASTDFIKLGEEETLAFGFNFKKLFHGSEPAHDAIIGKKLRDEFTENTTPVTQETLATNHLNIICRHYKIIKPF